MAHNPLQQQKPGRNSPHSPAPQRQSQAPAGLSESDQLQRLLGNEGVGQLVGGLPDADVVDRAANESFQAIVNRPIIQPKLQVNQPNDPYEQEADQVAERVQGGGQIGRQMKTAPAGQVQRLINKDALIVLAGQPHSNPLLSKTYKAVLKSLDEYHQLPPLADPAGSAPRLAKLAQLKQQATALKDKKAGETRTRQKKKEKVQSKAATMEQFVGQINSEITLGEMILQHQQNPNPETLPDLLTRLRRWIDNPTLPEKDRGAGQLLYMRLKSGDQDLIHNVQGGLPAGEADFSDKNNAGQVDKYVITLAVSQENAEWLENVENLRNVVMKKMVTSPITLAQKVKGGKFEEYAAESVLKKRESWAVKTVPEQEARLEEFTKGIHQVGHVWVRLATYSGNQVKDLHSYGFWPQKVYNPEKDEMEGGYAGFRAAGPGQVRHPDTEHEGDSNKMYYDYTVQPAQFQRAMSKAQERHQSPPPYILTDYNCTKFAQEIMTAAGLGFPGGGLLPGHIFTPGKVYHALMEMMNGGDNQAYNNDPLAATVAEVDNETTGRAGQARAQARQKTQDMTHLKPKAGASRENQTLYPGRHVRWGEKPDQVNQSRLIADEQPIRFVDDDDFHNYWQTQREGEKFPIVAVEWNGQLIYLMEQDYENARYGRPNPNAAREPITLYAGNSLAWGQQPDNLTENWQLNQNETVEWIRDKDFEAHWGRCIAVMVGNEMRFVDQANFIKARQEKKEKPAGSAIYPAGKHDVILPAPVTLQVTTLMGNSQQMLEIAANKKYIVSIMDQLTANGQAKLSIGMQSYLVALADLPKLGLNFGGQEAEEQKEEELSVGDQAVLAAMGTYSGIGSLDYSLFEQVSLTKKDLTSLTPAGRIALLDLLGVDEYDLDEAINMLDDEEEMQQPMIPSPRSAPGVAQNNNNQSPSPRPGVPPPSVLPPLPGGPGNQAGNQPMGPPSARPGVPPPSVLPPLPGGPGNQAGNQPMGPPSARPGVPPPSALPPLPGRPANQPGNGQIGPPRNLRQAPGGQPNRAGNGVMAPPRGNPGRQQPNQARNRPGVPPPRNLPPLPNPDVQRSPAGDDLARQSLQNIVNRPIYGAEEAQ